MYQPSLKDTTLVLKQMELLMLAAALTGFPGRATGHEGSFASISHFYFVLSQSW